MGYSIERLGEAPDNMKRRVLSQKDAIRGFMERYEERGVSPPPEVEKPTYEVVGKIERYDQRDQPTARAYLMPGSVEYDEYYSRHPELKEWDDENRRRRAKQEEEWVQIDPIGSQFGPSVFYSRRVLGLPEIVEGKVAARHQVDIKGRVNADPLAVAQIIKSYARYLGASKVRITRLNQDWVYTNYAHPYTLEPYGKPVELNYKYIVCMAFPQNRMLMASGDGIAEYLEVGWIYTYASLVSVIIAQFIRSLGWQARGLTSENSAYLVVPTFVDAGVGEQGRCSYVVTKEFGNNFRPGAVATDMPLAVDKPVDFRLQDFCQKCKICAEACPSGAIPTGDKQVVRGVRIWYFDGNKCRRYWDTIGHPCGICQYVCPWNFPNYRFHNIVRELAQRSSLMRTLAIKGHHLFYGDFQRGPQPEWIMRNTEALTKTTREESNNK